MNETCIKHALNMPDIGGCPYCEIDRLKAELEEAQELVARYDDIKDDLQMDKAELQNQLAEARAEVDRQQKEIIALRKSVIGLERCSSDEAPGLIKQQARQDVAREIICKHIEFFIADTHDRRCLINSIRRTFKLEG